MYVLSCSDEMSVKARCESRLGVSDSWNSSKVKIA